MRKLFILILLASACTGCDLFNSDQTSSPPPESPEPEPKPDLTQNKREQDPPQEVAKLTGNILEHNNPDPGPEPAGPRETEKPVEVPYNPKDPGQIQLSELIKTIGGMNDPADKDIKINTTKLLGALTSIQASMRKETAFLEKGDLRLSQLIERLEKKTDLPENQKKLVETLKLIHQNLKDKKPPLPREFTDTGTDPFYFAMRTMENAYRQDPPDIDGALQALGKLQAIVREKADLEIRNLTLCAQVNFFGNYEPLEKKVASRGKEIKIYYEVENFQVKPFGPQYQLMLPVRIRILDAGGRMMHEVQQLQKPTRTRRPITDYFHAPLITIPHTLPKGQYILNIIVNDNNAEKTADARIGFEIK